MYAKKRAEKAEKEKEKKAQQKEFEKHDAEENKKNEEKLITGGMCVSNFQIAFLVTVTRQNQLWLYHYTYLVRKRERRVRGERELLHSLAALSLVFKASTTI